MHAGNADAAWRAAHVAQRLAQRVCAARAARLCRGALAVWAARAAEQTAALSAARSASAATLCAAALTHWSARQDGLCALGQRGARCADAQRQCT